MNMEDFAWKELKEDMEASPESYMPFGAVLKLDFDDEMTRGKLSSNGKIIVNPPGAPDGSVGFPVKVTFDYSGATSDDKVLSEVVDEFMNRCRYGLKDAKLV